MHQPTRQQPFRYEEILIDHLQFESELKVLRYNDKVYFV